MAVVVVWVWEVEGEGAVAEGGDEEAGEGALGGAWGDGAAAPSWHGAEVAVVSLIQQCELSQERTSIAVVGCHLHLHMVIASHDPA